MFKKNFIFSCIFFWFISSPVFAASMITDDPLFSGQWYLQNIQAPTAWQTTKGSSALVVAILDAGFDLSHPDLEQNTWVNTKEIAGNGLDDDLNGFVDDVYGWDFVDKDNTPEPTVSTTYDEGAISHGSVIAGIIGATANNHAGIAGINWNVKMMNVRILDNMGSGNSGSAHDGIQYAIKNGAKIINLSFTGFDHDPRLETAIKEANAAGVLVVAAVGNTKTGGINVDETPIYPACDGHGTPDNGMIGVASTDKTDTKSGFSNFGATCTDISAPGENIVSTVYQNSAWVPFDDGFYQDRWSGTSMAAPMVSGAAALLLSTHPKLTPPNIKNILRLSADPVSVTGAASGKMGAGRLNIAKALTLADTLFPPEVSVGSLVKLRCEKNATVDHPCKAVYFYATDGKRHAFPNDKVYFTWFSDFSSVKEVSSEFLASLTLGKNVTYHPGTKLVKFQTFPTVYAVESKGVLRAISSESVAASLYGVNWNKQVDDISDVFLGNYAFGSKIESLQDFNVILASTSLKTLSENF